MLAEAHRSLLLIVDIQERLAAAMDERDAMIRNSVILLQAATEMRVPILASEQYPQGLGHTVPELGHRLSGEDVVSKVEFSCWQNRPLRERIAASGKDQVIVAGIEAHVCVLETALDLRKAGKEVFVVADAVASRRVESREMALRRLSANEVEIVTTEMVVLEWLGSAASPSFKTISKLIR
jgi:isochorismate hydrolase